MSNGRFNPRNAKIFRFGKCLYDPSAGQISLSYQIDAGPELVEKLFFPQAPWPMEPGRQAVFEQALNLLHLIAGVSYYKAAVPPEVRFDGAPPNPLVADFITRLYVHGLAEFSYVNQLDLVSRLRVAADNVCLPSPAKLLLPERALVAMGGGKDSLVGLDLMRRSGIDSTPVCIGASALIENTVSAAGLPLLRIGRQLSPLLKELNESGAYNGHVPVTAINSAILLCAALLYGFRYVVFSNERSADEASLITPDGVTINHQFSKTTGFEKSFRNLVRSCVSPDIEYFSILRPFSELDIVRRFCALTAFHKVYSSCNRNFHLNGAPVRGRWCGKCPKCHFAALGLAVFLEPEEVRDIQGADLLDDLSHLDGFRAICGLGRDKPFECVGETGECRAALAELAKRPRWCSHAVVRSLFPELQSVSVPPMAELMRPSAVHFIPNPIIVALPGEFE